LLGQSVILLRSSWGKRTPGGDSPGEGGGTGNYSGKKREGGTSKKVGGDGLFWGMSNEYKTGTGLQKEGSEGVSGKIGKNRFTRISNSNGKAFEDSVGHSRTRL